MDASKNCAKRFNAKEVSTPKMVKFSVPDRWWISQTIWRRSGSENNHLDPGQLWARRRTRKSSRRIRRVSTTRLIAGWRWSEEWFLVHFRELHLPSPSWTQSQTVRAETRIIPNSTTIYWRDQGYMFDLACNARKPHGWLLECWRGPRSVRYVDRFHTIHNTG